MLNSDLLSTPSGMSDLYQTAERAFLWGSIQFGPIQFLPCVVLSSSTDSGNTPTTTLRKGLVMGRITSTGKITQYDPTATNGSEIPLGVLMADVNMLDVSGTAIDRYTTLLVSGPVLAAQILPAITSNMRKHMSPRFLFDDDLVGNKDPWRQTVAKTADYTVVAGTDNGKVFSTLGAAGAVNFTLPAVGASIVGERYRFYAEVDQSLTITAPAGKLVIFNNLVATSGAFSTAGNKIGAMAEIVANSDGTKWVFIQLCKHTLTVA
jgi:hypothetical protein